MKPKHDCGVCYSNFSQLMFDYRNSHHNDLDISIIINHTSADIMWKDDIRSAGYFIGTWNVNEAKRVYPLCSFINNLVIHSELMRQLLNDT